jgi:transposase InsO family protein
MEARRIRRRYDHRFRDLVRKTGDVELAVKKGVPRSTARDWSRLGSPKVITLDVASMSEDELRREVLQLRERNARLLAILRLVVVLLKVCEVSLSHRRVPDGEKKRLLLRTVDRSKAVLSLRSTLHIIGLTKTRYHEWKREEECELEDASSCPQSHPQQRTAEEREVVKDMVTSDDYRHVPTAILAILAQRLGKVFASPSTWHRLVRKNGWRRPRKRVHPGKPRFGIRASSPDEIWHVDTSVVRLLEGTRAYLYAVIDNFSRRILAWRVSERFDPANTLAILAEAGSSAHPGDDPPTLLADSGIENRMKWIDELVDSGALRRVLAQAEIACSNSLIESWWRSLKHQWFFLNELDSVRSLRRLAEFYVKEHNTRLPHSAFRGQTPDEMYFGTGHGVPDDLETKRKTAREVRMAANQARSCRVCRESVLT